MPFVRGNVRLTSKGIRVTRGYYRSPRGSSAAGAMLVGALVVVGVVLWILKAIFDFIVMFIVPISIIATIGLVAYGIVWARNRKLAQDVESLVAQVDDMTSSSSSEDAAWDQLSEKIEALRQKSGDVQSRLYESYRNLVLRIARDGKVTEEEKALLRTAEKSFALPSLDASQLKREGFLSYLDTVLLDGKITTTEEANLNHLVRELEIDMTILSDQRSLIAELVECREIAGGKLTEVSCSLPLKPGEKGYMNANATEFIRRKKSGNFFFEQGDRGVFSITNERVAFTSSSATIVPMKNILEVRVDPEAKRLEILKAGRQTPYCFQLEKPRLACTLIKTLIQGTEN